MKKKLNKKTKNTHKNNNMRIVGVSHSFSSYKTTLKQKLNDEQNEM